MSNNEAFHVNMSERWAINVYLCKIKKPYIWSHFIILRKRGILKESGHPTLVGNLLLKKYNGDIDYARRAIPRWKRATQRRRKKNR